MARLTDTARSLFQRIMIEKSRIEAEATRIGPGPERNELLAKLRRLDIAAHMDKWLSSPVCKHRDS
jgi:hypothetical protein